MEASGLSGGLAVLWDPNWIKAKAYRCLAGILISAQIRGKDCPINILNIYAPYKNRLQYWEKLFDSEIFDIESLMIAGDFNVTLNSDETWGNRRKKNPLADRIKYELLSRNLVEINPPKMLPTWENGRSGKAFIAKRLYRFILHASIIDRLGMPFTSIGNVFILNHRPILLNWREKGFRKGYSFKFNRSCLEDPEFNDIIVKTWKNLSSTGNLPPS